MRKVQRLVVDHDEYWHDLAYFDDPKYAKHVLALLEAATPNKPEYVTLRLDEIEVLEADEAASIANLKSDAQQYNDEDWGPREVDPDDLPEPDFKPSPGQLKAEL